MGDTLDHPEPARMECAEVSDAIYLTKTFEIEGDEPNCVTPFDESDENYLLFNISCGNPGATPSDPNYFGGVDNVIIVDYLPFEVDFDSATGGGVYNEPNHTVTWIIGELAPGDSNDYTVKTKVNEVAEPLSEIYNFVDMSGDNYHSWTSCSVPVCCWGPDIIYVDIDAVYDSGEFPVHWESGFNTGTCWEDAYTDLQDALARARRGCGNEIWVAEGTYIPDGNDVNVSFDMVQDVGIYGGFDGTETQRDQRNWNTHETILSGYIDDYKQSNNIVTASDYLGDATLDGFTVKDGKAGIYCEDTWDGDSDPNEPIFANCMITDIDNYGMQFNDFGDASVNNCEFIANNYGVRIEDNSWPLVNNCTITQSDIDGIWCSNSRLSLTSCYVYNNTDDGLFFSGSIADVNSCDISNNGNEVYGTGNGINAEFSSANINKCIIENNINNGILSDRYNDYEITQSIICLNGANGIFCKQYSEIANICNNWIHHNGMHGIRTSDISSGENVIICNNTVVANNLFGISCISGRSPYVQNNILYYNNPTQTNNPQIFGIGTTYYCCTYDPNNITCNPDINGNITCDPNFAYADPDLYNYWNAPRK